MISDEQGKIMDEIIEKHRQNNGVFDWNPYILSNGTLSSYSYRTIIFVLEFLKTEKIVADYNSYALTTSLTEKGQDWKSYKKYIKEKEDLEKGEKRESWQKRNWFLLAIGAYIMGFFTDPLKSLITEKFSPDVKETSSIKQKADSTKIVSFDTGKNMDSKNKK
jgi:hypothetical protein